MGQYEEAQMKKICVVCGKSFETNRTNVICCSEACKDIRKRAVAKKYKQEHKDEINEYQKAYSKLRYSTEFGPVRSRTKQQQQATKVSKKESPWVRNYLTGDRITKIAMLSKALFEYQIEMISYGQLSLKYNTDTYKQWEEQVIERKRKEHDADNLKTKNSIKSKIKLKDL
jgi:predicted nucleic acid-binding Zn ribbon protein